MPFSPFSSFSPSVSAVFPQFRIFSKSLLRCFALRRSPCHLFSSYLTASNEDLLSNFVISPEIQSALDHGKAIVALESTVITHGLPHPTNLNVAIRLEEIVREENAVPATIALLDGHIHVGLSRDELKQIAMPERNAVKVSRRDLATCLVEKKIGGTTVAATMCVTDYVVLDKSNLKFRWIAHRAGIRIFATGGIGGVHRGDQQDVSADLTELGRTPIGVVCAGVKSLLDIGRTLEYLETQSVCVVVLDKNAQFPGFFGPPTALKAPYHTNSLQKIADILEFLTFGTVLSSQMGLPNGTLIACPLTDDAIDQQMANGRNSIAEATETALREADEAGIRGKEVTPFVLQRIRQRVGTAATELSQSSLPMDCFRSDIALLENNVRIGAQLALLCSNKMSSFSSTGKRHFANATSQCQNVGTLKRGRPKIVCAGASIVDVAVFLDNYAAHPLDTSTVGTYVPARIVQTPGGVARNHADALSRLGCDVTLISALGTMTGRQNKAKNGDGKKQQRDGNEVDLFGRFLMDKCKHIDWSHVCHCLDTPTASSVGVCSKGTVISQGFISVDSIMEHIDDKYLRSIEGQIANADFVLVDANLNSRSLRTIAEMAQMNGTKIWFEPTNWTKVPKLFEALGKNALHKVSAISPNMDELEELAEQLEDGKCQTFVHGFKAFLASLCSSATPAAQFASLINQWIAKNEAPAALFPPSMSHLLITCDSMGVLLLDHPPGSSSFAPLALHFASPPNVCADQIVSVSGAGDCFNSGFLAALLSGCSIDESVELANKCATISLCSAETVPEAIDQLKLNGNWVANA